MVRFFLINKEFQIISAAAQVVSHISSIFHISITYIHKSYIYIYIYFTSISFTRHITVFTKISKCIDITVYVIVTGQARPKNGTELKICVVIHLENFNYFY